MNYNLKQETSRMLELMTYGINENTSKVSAPRVEYQVKAADGQTYGIVNEGNKFYIKVAPKKDTQVVNEDFCYIGGEMNKKQNEYKSYAAASKNLELKLMQINESHKANRVPVETFKQEPAADWQINETVEMRAEIDRMNQISRNVAMILTEGSIPSEHTLPEAPSKNPSQEKVNAPFTDSATAKGDKDFTETETDYKKPSGSPYDKEAKPKMESDKNPSCDGNCGNAYSEKAQYTPNGAIANVKATGGKVTRADENKKVFKLTEQQVLAWNNTNADYMDKSNGTKIGSSAPYNEELDGKTSNQEDAPTEPIHEGENAVHNSATKLFPNGGVGEVGHKGDPHTEKVLAEDGFEDEDIAGFDTVDDEEEVPFPEVENDDMSADIENNQALYDEAMGGFDDDTEYELELNEDTLNDFGKHPAYRKSPMQLPPNKEVAPNGVRDWNDDSVEGEEPYGKKIGSSAPFEKAVKMITDSVMESLGF